MSDVNWEAHREAALANFSLADLPPNLELPALPTAVTTFLERSKQGADTKELAQILETDTGLTMELLKFVNSSFIGVRHKISTVQQALNLLGEKRSKTFVLSTGMQAAVRAKKSKLINQQCFWNACMQKALFAQQVAVLLKTDPEVAFSGALLQDFLLPVVTNLSVDAYLHLLDHRAQCPETLCDYEQEQFGWDHALAAASLAHRWNLPDELVCCILYHHKGLSVLADPELKRTPVAAVALSALLPDQLRQHFLGLEQLVMLTEKWKAFDIRNLIETVDELHESNSMGITNDFPLRRRCQWIFQDGEAVENPPSTARGNSESRSQLAMAGT